MKGSARFIGMAVVALLVALWVNQRSTTASALVDTPMPTVVGNDSSGEKFAARNMMPRVRERPESPEPQPLEKLQAAVQRRLNEWEAERAILLTTVRTDERTRFLFEIEAPSPEEVRELRKEIAGFGKQVAPEMRQEFDEYVEFLVRAYDPFGKDGLQGVLLDIPEGQDQPVSGQTFSMNDSERAAFRAALEDGVDSFTFRNYRGFHREDGQMPERFEALFEMIGSVGEGE